MNEGFRGKEADINMKEDITWGNGGDKNYTLSVSGVGVW
jgi:hypothetical protein